MAVKTGGGRKGKEPVVLHSVNAPRRSVHLADDDAHPILQRTQLLQLLEELERRGRQRDKTLQCGRPERV